MEAKSMEASGTMCFHGIEYSVEIWVQRDELHVQVEEESLKATADVDRWGGAFPPYIEELTKKTGNFKRFYTFVNMLVSALNHKSDSVFIDLLTYSDLELYRKRKLGKSSAEAPPAAALHATNKRYLILTYAVEFDRVHYPLPLLYIEQPTPDILQKTILRLKQALTDAKVDGGVPDKQLTALQDENTSLRLQIKQLQALHDAAKVPSSDIIELKAQIELLERQHSRDDVEALEQRYGQRIRQLEKDVERERADHHRLVLQLERQLEDEQTKAGAAETELRELQLKNRELMRQLAVARTKSTPHRDRPQAATTAPQKPRPRSTTVSSRPSSGHDSSDGARKPRYTAPAAATTFKRFDPTAYHLERQAKLRARSQSPQPPSRSSSAPRQPIMSGYSSDSSAGYQSGGSNASRRPRPRSRQGSTERQRDADARLASPRWSASTKAPLAVSSRRSPSPTVPRKATTPLRGSRAPAKTTAPKPPARSKPTVLLPAVPTTPQYLYDDDESDTEAPSTFTDIDNRLNALQQFLRDAKTHQPKLGRK
ncbi:hypothetical protein SPRG_03837 [Saprolegnia parasitica CBS 223.65]|uniref:Coiled-coil domain-containing protein 61 n=1 Tax=Saprolegnia parasitica (strain CBS 223.65) TaxID=695850 RepID=A0A067CKI3_SAPPC|nr:hypothetical protein SPRG_03837 [Saprolegnia parasitica CBS 223.65]KDO31219.1 hypothetical protein SPRG_03837 [Saprolegnia parasitica CBS 223.65]|eukprot:XP_012197824.1 hypothetical protein SPRG_03837 [Saprolegnia parasitica CBS 223.65]